MIFIKHDQDSGEVHKVYAGDGEPSYYDPEDDQTVKVDSSPGKIQSLRDAAKESYDLPADFDPETQTVVTKLMYDHSSGLSVNCAVVTNEQPTEDTV